MNKPTPTPRARTDRQTRLDLQEWDSEGGAPAGGAPGVGDLPPPMTRADAPLLQLLGAALVGEWNRLPMPLRRAVYGRAVAGGTPGRAAVLKRRLARFLHDHKGRADRA